MKYLIKDARAVIHASETNVTDIRIAQGCIVEMGCGLTLAPDEILIQAKHCVVYPGLINTHHHLAQSVLKGIPEGLNQGLGEWLASVPYRFWPKFTPELMYVAAKLGLSELLRSGATTCADHHYLYHATSSPELEDAVWQAADEMGVRFVLCRGGATQIRPQKGLSITPESVDAMLQRLEETYTRYHQSDSKAMRRLVVAPTSLIHGCSPQDLVTLANWSISKGVKRHSHLLEVDFDELQAQMKYKMSATEYAESCGWLGQDVWFAHLVKATPGDIQRLAKSQTGIGHCPTSNCRLGSGIAPVIDMMNAGMPITLGVDGSASSESGSMIQELNLAWLLQRSQKGAGSLNLETVLQWGSRDAAKLLDLNTGELALGKAADIVLYDCSDLRYQGVHAAQWAPLLCGEPVKVAYSFVQGRLVVEDGRVLGCDEFLLRETLIRELQALAARIG